MFGIYLGRSCLRLFAYTEYHYLSRFVTSYYQKRGRKGSSEGSEFLCIYKPCWLSGVVEEG